jgi:hypothetical protein
MEASADRRSWTISFWAFSEVSNNSHARKLPEHGEVITMQREQRRDPRAAESRRKHRIEDQQIGRAVRYLSAAW